MSLMTTILEQQPAAPPNSGIQDGQWFINLSKWSRWVCLVRFVLAWRKFSIKQVQLRTSKLLWAVDSNTYVEDLEIEPGNKTLEIPPEHQSCKAVISQSNQNRIKCTSFNKLQCNVNVMNTSQNNSYFGGTWTIMVYLMKIRAPYKFLTKWRVESIVRYLSKMFA